MLSWFSRATLVAISISAAACAWSQKSSSNAAEGSAPVSFGAVRPGNLVLPQISIQVGGDANLGNTVQKCLELADIAVPPANGDAVAAAAAKDRQLQQGIDFDAWTAAGVTYVLRGVANGASGQAELYDVATRRRVFGNNYQNAGDAHRLAFKMADDVIKAVSGGPGIFSSRIALLTGQASGKREVAVMSPDGSGQSVITSENAIVATPSWGRNGSEIFYTSYRENNPDLYGITVDRRRFNVSRRPGLNTSPSWSAAAQRLAVSLSKDGNSEIYTMGADGSGLVRLTNSPSAETAPEWSPDGSRIAFTSDESGQPQIYVMSSNGSGRQKISSGYSDSPSWSPDGKKLAYVKRESGGFNIYVQDIASGTATRITNGGDNMEPSWAPNSLHIVYASNKGGARNIYLINSQTKRGKQLTTKGTFSSPTWGPLQQ